VEEVHTRGKNFGSPLAALLPPEPKISSPIFETIAPLGRPLPAATHGLALPTPPSTRLPFRPRSYFNYKHLTCLPIWISFS
jgi:hypothetical protein